MLPSSVKEESLSTSPRCRKICRPPKSLRKTFIKADCQNSQLTTKFRNFINKAWGDRSKRKNDSSDRLFFPFSKLPVGALTTGFSVEASRGKGIQGRRGGHNCCLSLIFLPNGFLHMAVPFCHGLFIILPVFTTKANLYHISKNIPRPLG